MLSTQSRSYYRTILEGVGNRRSQVISFLLKSDIPKSRSQIAEGAGLTLQCVCGRVNELIDMLAIEVKGEVLDKKTNRNVEAVHLVDNSDHVSLSVLKKALGKKERYINYMWKHRDLEKGLTAYCDFG